MADISNLKINERANVERPNFHYNRGGGQNLERRNGERPVFRNFKITNIKMKKDHFIFELF